MTREEYITLIKEFGLKYNISSTSAYYKCHPVCGWRKDRAESWDDNSLIIFSSFVPFRFYNGLYCGTFNGNCSADVSIARNLIKNRIKEIKEIYINQKLCEINKDFENGEN